MHYEFRLDHALQLLKHENFLAFSSQSYPVRFLIDNSSCSNKKSFIYAIALFPEVFLIAFVATK